MGCRGSVIALVQLAFIFHGGSPDLRPAAETRGVTQPGYAAKQSGILEGMATLACEHGAISCKDRPYQVGLFIQPEQSDSATIYVYASPRFSISVEAGSYTISSADTRGAFGLPILEPITVMISPGTVTHVDVRFEPGLELPRR